MNGKKLLCGYFRNDRKMNITNSWIFLALSISDLFSTEYYYVHRGTLEPCAETLASLVQGPLVCKCWRVKKKSKISNIFFSIKVIMCFLGQQILSVSWIWRVCNIPILLLSEG